MLDGVRERVGVDGRRTAQLGIVVDDIELGQNANGACHAFVRGQRLTQAETRAGVEAVMREASVWVLLARLGKETHEWKWYWLYVRMLVLPSSRVVRKRSGLNFSASSPQISLVRDMT